MPVSDVVRRYLPIRQAGREWKGCCPFHKEKTPSFHINDEKGFYHCFGCGAHGDTIRFIEQYERLPWPEAVKRLAEMAGVALPRPDPVAEARAHREDSLYDVCEAACTWFQLQLIRPEGMAARRYLEQRGIRQDTITRFRLGLAPDGRNGLLQHLQKQGISTERMLEAGLLTRRDDGALSDKFRGRLIFPIHSRSNKVVAFGGRVMRADRQPKYLNSPETPLFHKSRMLYHFHHARTIRNGAPLIVAEGYMDVIALMQAGFPTAVAPMGTALTAEQLALLWSSSPEPILCLDGDAAGQRAMQRAAELALPLLKPGFSLRFALLPEGEDPDSFLRRHGAKAMQQMLRQARTLAETVWQAYVGRYPATTPEEAARLENALFQAVETIQDITVRKHYNEEMRGRLFALRREKRIRFSSPGAIERKCLSPSFSANALTDAEAIARRRERDLLTILLQYPSLLLDGRVEEEFVALELEGEEHNRIRTVLLEWAQEQGEEPDFAALSRQLAQLKTGGWFTAYSASSASDEDIHQAHTDWNQALASFQRLAVKKEAEVLSDSTPSQEIEALEWEKLRQAKLSRAAE